MTVAVVAAIEVSRRLVETAEAGKDASLLLEGARKDQIVQGTVLMEAPEAPPQPVSPAGADAVRYDTGEPSPYSPEPISSSSGWGRSILYIILMGLLILLALLFSQGKLDMEKWDPRKWDPRKKKNQHSGTRGQHSALLFHPSVPVGRRRKGGAGGGSLTA